MSKSLRLIAAAILGVVAQTTLVQYVRIAGVAPDMLIALLVAVTSYCGPYGGYCMGAVMSLLYDASVGYVLAVNLVTYTLIGLVAPMMRSFMDRLLHRFKHKSYLEMTIICFLLTAVHEIVYIGYMFIIGAEQSLTTLLRLLLCSGYSALMALPCAYLLGKLMNWHPKLEKGRQPDTVKGASAGNPRQSGRHII